MTAAADGLMRIVGRFAAELPSLDDTAASAGLTAAAWSTKEIVGHPIESAADNHHRCVRAHLGHVRHHLAQIQKRT